MNNHTVPFALDQSQPKLSIHRAWLVSLTPMMILLLVSCEKPEPPQKEANSMPMPTPASRPSQFPQNAYTQREAELDKQLWQSADYVDLFTDYLHNAWEQLRSPKPWALLVDLDEPTQWQLPRWDRSTRIEHDIRLFESLSPSTTTLSNSAFADQLKDWQRQGHQLEQLELRHRRCRKADQNDFESTVWISFHLKHVPSSTRRILRGTGMITWSEDNGRCLLEGIDLSQLQLLERAGDPVFDHVIPIEMTPNDGLSGSEPNLHVVDINRDQQSDILITRLNQAYLNQGQGTFIKKTLLGRPPTKHVNGLFADFNNDEQLDFLSLSEDGLHLFKGLGAEGQFDDQAEPCWTPPNPLENPFAITAGDLDQDNDLDLYIGQYKAPYREGQMPTPFYNANDGYPSYLLENDGKGNFQAFPPTHFPSEFRNRRVYSASIVDLNDDSKQDLVVVADFAGVDYYKASGPGKLVLQSPPAFPTLPTFGMAHTFRDLDHNGQLDIVAIGMNSYSAQRLGHLGLTSSNLEMQNTLSQGNRVFLQKEDGTFDHHTPDAVAQTGWSWGVAAADFDNDGDQDLYIANGHITGAKTKDYEEQFWRYDILFGTSEANPQLQAYFDQKQRSLRQSGYSFGGNEYNRFLLNLGSGRFIEVAYLFGLSLAQDSRNVVADDLDNDGRVDLLVGTFQSWPEIRQEVHLFPNFTEPHQSWIGFDFQGSHILGGSIQVRDRGRSQKRHLVTGESYRSQHPFRAHFGFREPPTNLEVEIKWPHGQKLILTHPELNRYHRISSP